MLYLIFLEAKVDTTGLRTGGEDEDDEEDVLLHLMIALTSASVA